MSGIIFFGDSIYLGFGATQRNFGCCKLIKKEIKLPVIVKAKSGYSTRDAIKNMEKCVLNEKDYSHVFILFGNNDCRVDEKHEPYEALVGLYEYENNINKIVEMIIAGSKKAIIVGLQPLSDEIIKKVKSLNIREGSPQEWQSGYNSVCKKVAENKKIGFIDIRKVLLEKNIYAADGMHPNDLGHRIIADAITEYIKKNIAD